MGKGRFGLVPLLLASGFVAAQAYWRSAEQTQSKKVRTRTGVSLLKTFDLRGADQMMALVRQRESDDFRQRMRQRQKPLSYWPGLRATQVSWTWMQALNGMHTDTAFRGDYSWLFSKIDFLNRSLHGEQDLRGLTLAPFFLVIGVDGVGSTLLVRDWIRRYPDEWKTWFYAGYHAMDNLKMPRLAADYFERGLKFPQTPAYVVSLVLRLREENLEANSAARKAVIESLDPQIRERLERMLPEWFR